MVSSIIKPFILAFGHVFKSRFTVKYPYDVVKQADTWRGRPRLNMEKCIGCSVCAKSCLNIALEMVHIEEQKFPQLDLGRCCFCGLCADACPKLALEMTREYESSEYTRESLLYTPQRLSQPPKRPAGKVKKVKKYHKILGVSHG